MIGCNRRILMKFKGGMLENTVLLQISMVECEYIVSGDLCNENLGDCGNKKLNEILAWGFQKLVERYSYEWIKEGSILIY